MEIDERLMFEIKYASPFDHIIRLIKYNDTREKIFLSIPK